MIAGKILDHSAVRLVSQAARDGGQALYLVGGAVRARLLAPEQEINNLDLLVLGEARAFGETIAALLHSQAIVVNPDFDTVLVPLSDAELEISGPRSLLHRHDLQIGLPDDPLPRDLFLRDFTINAMAEPLASKDRTLQDPTGGRADLRGRILRTPIAAGITLREDPLRILRAARLAAQLNFSLDAELLTAMHSEREGLTSISVERKTSELLKILGTAKPSIAFKLLHLTGVLDVAFPEIAALAGLKQDQRHRHKDVFEHTLKVVDTVAALGGNAPVRLAALWHDVGKPATRRYDPVSGWTFHGHEMLGEKMAQKLGRTWKLPTALTDHAAKLVRLHMRPINLTDEGVTDSAVRRLGVQAGEDVEALLTLCRADVTSSDPARVKRYLANFEKVVEHLHTVNEKDEMRAFQSPVRGEEIMAQTGLAPGPPVGKLKKMIEEAILDGVIPHDHDAALAYLHQIKDVVLRQEEADKNEPTDFLK